MKKLLLAALAISVIGNAYFIYNNFNTAAQIAELVDKAAKLEIGISSKNSEITTLTNDLQSLKTKIEDEKLKQLEAAKQKAVQTGKPITKKEVTDIINGTSNSGIPPEPKPGEKPASNPLNQPGGMDGILDASDVVGGSYADIKEENSQNVHITW